MPELPEVETVVRGLRPKLEGHVLRQVEQRRANLRYPFPENFAQRLTGRRVERIIRRAKYMLLHLDDGQVLLCHLGMSGRMVIVEQGGDRERLPLDRHDHVVFTTEAGTEIRFNDARRFGIMDLFAETALDDHPLLRALGPEPLGNDFNGPALAAALKGKRTPIKSALLDQQVVAGLGNIYVCEALFFARLSPRRLAYTVQGNRAEKLAAAVRQVLTRAIEAGGSSLRDYVQASGELGYFQHEWAVYGREGEACRHCGAAIQRMVQSGRSTFYCSRCQR
ncbi:MAG: bifunctional DNA-formamidopyrimidine glycosylase/DNA-(apurinic or apyrimidinic site) lyase [Kiloniellaceae bacterium]